MSRIPRFQEHLKTGFTAEAASAARYRAYAARAQADGHAQPRPPLAAARRRQGRPGRSSCSRPPSRCAALDADLGNAISEERYENDILYPKMIRDVDQETANVFLRVVNAQKEHLRQLEALRNELNAAQGDVALPPEVDRGTAPSAPES